MDVARAKIKPRFHVLVADDRERCNDSEDTALITALRECSRESIANVIAAPHEPYRAGSDR